MIPNQHLDPATPPPRPPPRPCYTVPGRTNVCTKDFCAKNPRTFTRPGDYKMHMKRHTLPYKCPFPGCRWGRPESGFYQDRDLKKHMETHLAAASFRCPVEGCSSSATRDYNMVRHLKHQHGIMVKKAEIA